MEDINGSTKVVKLFSEVMRVFKHSMKKVFEDMGLTGPQGMVLGILSKEKTMKISDLSVKLNLSNSTVSGIVDRLENQGIVERNRSEEDKRVVYVSIAADFAEKHHQCFHQQIEETIERKMAQGTAEELEKICEGLEVLKKILSDPDNKNN